MMIITDEVLGKINAARAAKGLPPLEKQTAVKAVTQRRQLAVDQGQQKEQSSDFLMHFLIGYGTGIPMPSAGGIIGAMMHESSKPTSVDVSFTPSYADQKPVEHTPTPSSRDDDSHSYSSSSSDSGSSSSSDSGSSGGGGGGE